MQQSILLVLKTCFFVSVVGCERIGSTYLDIFKMIHIILTNA